MLRVTAKQQLMREIVELLSVLTEEAKLVWGEKGLHVTVLMLHFYLPLLLMNALRHMKLSKLKLA
jgi:hypothetical protein